eukprot:INCI1794.1.p1 GENE.INCI1794.1~~INCI1794.1.p1  ORF type:complete len:387 (-),score=69.15 INCI1794.1:131-1291(-)
MSAEKDDTAEQLAPLTPRASFDYEGFPVPWWFHTRTAEFIRDGLDLGENDIVLATVPKAGTHWMNSILRKVIDFSNGNTSSAVANMFLAEMFPIDKSQTPAIITGDKLFSEFIAEQGEEKIIPTHTFPHCLPRSLLKRGKLIYVLRNPKDALVSLYFFNGVAKDGWDGCSARFVDPNTRNPFGTFTDHVGAYTPLVQKLGDRAKVVYYEDLKRDFVGTVSGIAEFLGKDISREQAAEIQELLSLEAMRAKAKAKEDEDSKLAERVTVALEQGVQASAAAGESEGSAGGGVVPPATQKAAQKEPTGVAVGRKMNGRSAVFRKGAIGDWHNYFSEEQSREFDAWLEQELPNNPLIANLYYGEDPEQLPVGDAEAIEQAAPDETKNKAP